MARKLRLEFPGARYHLINRGNYRADIFASDRTKAAFEACLMETADKWSWLLHAFVVMSNHFHLAVETPQANLVRGMQWLEATFANRFNRFRHENGHLFQGRYRALLIGEDHFLCLVCDYIHLNPVRAGFQSLETLKEHRFSSYWHLLHPQGRPKCVRCHKILETAGGLKDTPEGWRQYARHLELELGKPAHGRRYAELSQGWAIGSDAFMAATISQHAPIGSARAWTLPGAEQMRDAQWRKELGRALAVVGHSLEEARAAPQAEIWKLAVATWLRDAARARSNWLSDQLRLGVPSAVSRNLARYRVCYQRTDPSWKALMSTFAA
jgi:putative transposase